MVEMTVDEAVEILKKFIPRIEWEMKELQQRRVKANAQLELLDAIDVILQELGY